MKHMPSTTATVTEKATRSFLDTLMLPKFMNPPSIPMQA